MKRSVTLIVFRTRDSGSMGFHLFIRPVSITMPILKGMMRSVTRLNEAKGKKNGSPAA